MTKVGEFEKVSFEQFASAMKAEFGYGKEYSKEIYDRIDLPTRATTGSAGYDFHSPVSFTLRAGESIVIPTGIRVKIENGWWLCCVPRSSLGFKYRIQLDNTIGVIDSDYYYSDNEGHIYIKITNDSNDCAKCCRVPKILAGDRIMQGIFLPYGVTYSDMANGVRNGGLGSTE